MVQPPTRSPFVASRSPTSHARWGAPRCWSWEFGFRAWCVAWLMGTDDGSNEPEKQKDTYTKDCGMRKKGCLHRWWRQNLNPDTWIWVMQLCLVITEDVKWCVAVLMDKPQLGQFSEPGMTFRIIMLSRIVWSFWWCSRPSSLKP